MRMKLIFNCFIYLAITIFFLGSINSQSVCVIDLPISQYNALHAFYNSTNGPNWCIYSGNEWDFSNNNVNSPCSNSWIGVQCSCQNTIEGTMYTITSLSLSNYCLEGSIPDDIVNLVDIYSISLSVNQLNGTIPSNIGYMQNLYYLDIYSSYLSGSLPDSFYNLTNVQELILSDNYLTGKLLPNISQLSNLFYLELNSNHFSGSLPSEICTLTSMFIFLLNYNDFTGEIPSNIGNLNLNIEVELNNNYLIGKIPTSIGKLTTVQALALNNNLLTGEIPSEIGTLKSAYSITLSYNQLTGTIPSQIANINNLQTFEINNNYFYSTLPTFLSSMKKLSVLQFENNFFHGTIPENLAAISRLQQLSIGNNYLTNTLPHQLLSLYYLETLLCSNNYLIGDINVTKSNYILNLDLSYNYFSNSLPSKLLYYSTILISLNLLNNYITGYLPHDIPSYTILILVVLGNNVLSGNIPTSYGLLTSLQVLYLFNNKLTGSLPVELYSLSSLEYIWISSNQFTGTISREFGQLSYLSEILLNNNQFHGNVLEIFNHTIQNYLQIINIADNLFSGTMPPSIFSLQRLSAFVAASNCMSGSIPNGICISNRTLTVLSLDGLGGNSKCINNVHLNNNKPFGITAYYQSQLLIGSIPSCLLQMKNLQTLHLSGNGLTGYLPDIVNDSIISDLSLSNNQLIGTIPKSIQLHSFNSLDLTSNRLNGVLVNNFKISPNQTLLTLAINRISGQLPETVSSLNSISMNISTLNILASNIYQCYSNEVPTIDSYSSSYYCGSSELNISLYVWIGIFVLIIISYTIFKLFLVDRSIKRYFNSGYIISFENRIKQTYVITKGWWNESVRLISTQSSDLPDYQTYHNIWLKLKQTKTLLLILQLYQYWTYGIIFLIIFTIPIFYIMNQYYSIVSYSYTYEISITYIHGYEIVLFIGILVMTILFISTILITNIEPIFITNLGNPNSPVKTLTNDKQKAIFTLKKYFYIYFLHFINLFVTILVNACYVNAILSYKNLSRLNLLFIQLSISIFKLCWNNIYIPWITYFLTKYISTPRSLQNRLIMSITNYILAPLIATIATNQSCFYFAIISNQPIVTTNYIEVCTQFSQDNKDCLKSTNVSFSTTFIPAFQYSYACGTALLVTYTPVLIYTYVFAGLLAPLVRYLAALFPYLLKPISLVNDILFIEPRNSQTYQVNKQEIKKGIIRVKGRGVTVTIMLHITVLLSFGLACPLLAIAIIITIINDSLMWRLLVGRYILLVTLMRKMYNTNNDNNIESSLNPKKTKKSIDADSDSNINNISGNYRNHSLDPSIAGLSEFNILENDIEDSWRGLFSCFYIVIITVVVFWGLLMFDMIADKYGSKFGGFISCSYVLITCFMLIAYLMLPTNYQYRSRVLLEKIKSKFNIDNIYEPQSRTNSSIIINPMNESFNNISRDDRTISVIEMNSTSNQSLKSSIDRSDPIIKIDS